MDANSAAHICGKRTTWDAKEGTKTNTQRGTMGWMDEKGWRRSFPGIYIRTILINTKYTYVKMDKSFIHHFVQKTTNRGAHPRSLSTKGAQGTQMTTMQRLTTT